jgi:hypothetical protein
MTEEDKKNPHMDSQIWTPPETIDNNTQRMASILFIEEIKAFVQKAGIEDYPLERVPKSYGQALSIAKMVREAEIKAGGS